MKINLTAVKSKGKLFAIEKSCLGIKSQKEQKKDQIKQPHEKRKVLKFQAYVEGGKNLS